MAWLIQKLAPIAMIVIGGLIGIFSLDAAMGKGETEPTTVSLSEVKSGKNAPEWLTLTGGGLYVGEVAEYVETRENSKSETTKAMYVSLMTEEQARARDMAYTMRTSPTAHKPYVIVKFSPDDFEKAVPNFDENKQEYKFEELFVALEPSGTRLDTDEIGSDLKKFVSSEWGVPSSNVLVLQYGKEPLQQGGAIFLVLLGLALAAGGSFWMYKRLTSKDKKKAARLEQRRQMAAAAAADAFPEDDLPRE